MKFAYADPPYLGCAKKHYGDHPEAGVYDTILGHKDLIGRLVAEFPDGWALSMNSGNLQTLLPLCPPGVRVMPWVKPFCSFKPGVNPAYAWEPVVVFGGRKRTRNQPTIRDWVSANITLKKGVSGVKPPAFCEWLFSVLNTEPGDELIDLFPGSGAVTTAWLMS